MPCTEKLGARIMLIAWLVLLLSGCLQPIQSEQSITNVTPTPLPDSINVAGTYDTKVVLSRDNTCGEVETRSLPTIIEQEAGEPNFVFIHADIRYEGMLQADGTFTTKAHNLKFGSTSYRITWQGKFTGSEMIGTGRVDVSQTEKPQQCYYVVEIAGEK